jgi:NADPH:quinone reductase-like Zn-dependent oxidoreductase
MDTQMKAIVYTKYGPPDVLQLKEVEKPVPGDNDVLVKVYAASVNSWDWDLLRGKPLVFRFWGLLKPKYQIPGADIAGKVETVGKNVRQFQPGDEVFGDLCACGWGGFAEYVCAHKNALTLKPTSMTFEEAAAIPQAAVMALQGIRDKGQVRPGQKVLINGAGGGVGTFAVQMAKSFGAEVTGVDSTEKLDIMRSTGADQVIDYTQEDFTKNGLCYNMILDIAAYHSIFDYKHSLSPEGVYIMVGGSPVRIFQTIFLGPLISMTGNKKMGILAHKPNKDLAFIKELFETGKVVPVIDKRYPLNETPEAFRYFGEGHVRGKVVITVEHNSKI